MINQDWVNILNIFDQQPISRLANRQKLRDKKQLLQTPLDFDSEIKRQKLHRLSLLETISKSHNLDLFNYDSVKIIIEHSWTNFGYGFFKLQLWFFLIFFLLPFWVDIYNLDFVLKN